MLTTHPNFSDYMDRMEAFKKADADNKKRLLIELMVFNGYDIIDWCKNWNLLTASCVRRAYVNQLNIYLK